MFENINKVLYGSKSLAYFILRISSIGSSIVALALIIYGYGFYLSPDQMDLIFVGIDIVYVSFLINYLFRIVYSFKRRSFLKRTWFELFLLLTIIVNYALRIFYDLGPQREFYKKFIVLFLIIISLYEFIKISTRINLLKFKPTTLFITSFLLLILIGTLLLMLPTSSYGRESMSFIDALFTATSASCVTGLIVVDTPVYFTFKGELIILILFQCGGLGIISFATFFSTFFSRTVGIKHQSIMQNIFSSESLMSAQGLFKQVILITLAIELIFSVAIYFTWGRTVNFSSIGEKIYFSIFHAISAFCNAGFSLFSGGLYEKPIQGSYILHIVVATAIILGGFGFPVLEDLFNIHKLRERLRYPWKDWHLSTKITIYSSLALIIFGMILFYLLEMNNTLVDMNFMEALIASFFQSVAARTAGFNTVDITVVTEPTSLIIIFLMFIGASPASTGGGIKTTTFVIILTTAIAVIRESGRVELGRRTIQQEVILKAFSVLAFAVMYNFLCVLILRITEPGIAFLDLCFEQISAFGTVGLTRGVTPHLSVAGKCVIITTMFVGRVGLITLAVALSKRVTTTAYRYPSAHLMVG